MNDGFEGDAEGALKVGVAHEERGEDQRAEELYRFAAGEGLPDAFDALARLLARLARPGEALQLLEAAPLDEGQRQLLRGNALQDLGELEQALAAFDASAEAGELGALHNAGYLLAFLDRVDEAIRYWTDSHAAGETTSYSLSGLLADAGRYDEAIALLRTESDAGDTAALVEIGAIEQERNRLAEAEAVLREALAASEPEAYAYLASVLQRRGHHAQAFEVLERGAQAHVAAAQLQLANELANVDIDNERIETLYRAAAESGLDEAATNLGIHLLELGRESEAMTLLAKAADRGDELAHQTIAEHRP